jgi:cob(I)alamin adenosyltransferase
MSSFYTRAGDGGTTGLLGEGRLPKYHERMETLGALDEATAALGLARSLCRADQTPPILLRAQRDLYRLMAETASPPENAARFHSVDPADVEWLEAQTDAIGALVELPKEFIVPGDSQAGAALALARTVVRRAERRAVELFDRKEIVNADILRYLNRLSSLCFVLELLENAAAGQSTTLAKGKS